MNAHRIDPPPGRLLAQYNHARLRWPVEDPRIAPFLDGAQMIWRIAERSPGFVWAVETGPGGTVEPPVRDDRLIVVNMTLWRDAAGLKHFVWRTLHRAFLARRSEWFSPMEGPTFVMWHVAHGHRPTVAEGLEMLDRLGRATGRGGGCSICLPLRKIEPTSRRIERVVIA